MAKRVGGFLARLFLSLSVGSMAGSGGFVLLVWLREGFRVPASWAIASPFAVIADLCAFYAGCGAIGIISWKCLPCSVSPTVGGLAGGLIAGLLRLPRLAALGEDTSLLDLVTLRPAETSVFLASVTLGSLASCVVWNVLSRSGREESGRAARISRMEG